LLNFNTYYDSEEQENEYPEAFVEWDNAVRRGKKPGFFSPDDMLEIIEIYLEENRLAQARQAIDYVLALNSGDEDLICDILFLLEDYEMWNDLLTMSERYREEAEEFGEGHKLTALLHLGMEDEAFLFFGTLKKKYRDDKETLGIVYAAMGEALLDLDLFDSCDAVMNEAISVIGEEEDFIWVRMQALVGLKNKEEVIRLANKIQKRDTLNGETWSRLGDIYRDVGEPERACEAYLFAVTLGYEPQENVFNMVFTLEESDQPERALAALYEFEHLFEDKYYLYFTAAELCSQFNAWSSALRFINEAIAIDPSSDPSLYLCKSNYLMNIEEYKAAELALKEGINATGDETGTLKEELARIDGKHPN